MPEHIWTVLCARILEDPDNKVMTLLDIVESLTEVDLDKRLEAAIQEGKKGVLINSPMQLVSWWSRSNPEESGVGVRVRILDPAGRMTTPREVFSAWKGEENTTLKVLIKMATFPVVALGLYWIVIDGHMGYDENKEASRWKTVAKLPLRIDKE